MSDNYQPPKAIAMVVWDGGLTDAPGIVIYVGADGKIHVKHVPGWNPDISAAISVLGQAARLDDRMMAQQLDRVAENILQKHAAPIMKTLEAAARTAEEGAVKAS